ncbi:MAG: thioredoxin family protein [Patescibacteria group bacterium]|nr:thioredoxin family protein [Patescibacteria group bacterium]
MPITNITNQQDFEQTLQNNKLVVADFYSTDCPPCANLAPIYEAVAEKYSDVKFIKIMRQENRELAQSYFVMSSPSILFFRGGQLLDNRLSGTINQNELEAAIQALRNNK